MCKLLIWYRNTFFKQQVIRYINTPRWRLLGNSSWVCSNGVLLTNFGILQRVDFRPLNHGSTANVSSKFVASWATKTPRNACFPRPYGRSHFLSKGNMLMCYVCWKMTWAVRKNSGFLGPKKGVALPVVAIMKSPNVRIPFLTDQDSINHVTFWSDIHEPGH